MADTNLLLTAVTVTKFTDPKTETVAVEEYTDLGVVSLQIIVSGDLSIVGVTDNGDRLHLRGWAPGSWVSYTVRHEHPTSTVFPPGLHLEGVVDLTGVGVLPLGDAYKSFTPPGERVAFEIVGELHGRPVEPKARINEDTWTDMQYSLKSKETDRA